MTQISEFIDLALNGLPKDKYRRRIQAELTDHLLELADELEVDGYSPEDVQARAIELMGDPAHLNPSFREIWIRRTSNFKYCVGAFFKAAFHAFLVNTFLRYLLTFPLAKIAASDLLESLFGYNSPIPIFLFALVYVLPGLWFSARELSERFAIHPHRKRLLLCGFLTVWFLDMLPFLPTIFDLDRLPAAFHFLTGGIRLPMYLGHLLLIALAWDNSFDMNSASIAYNFSILILCILFARFYRPKHSKPFILSDKT